MKENKVYAKELLKNASGRLAMAENVLGSYQIEFERGLGTEMGYGVEMILKALLFSNDIEPKKTHDIAALMVEVENKMKIDLDSFADLTRLTEYTSTGRYDSAYTAEGEKYFQNLVILARDLYTLAAKKIK